MIRDDKPEKVSAKDANAEATVAETGEPEADEADDDDTIVVSREVA